jgi:hypothetical protein
MQRAHEPQPQIAKARWYALGQSQLGPAHCFVRYTSLGAVLQGEEARRPAPLRAPGNRSQLVLFRSRGDYGCVGTTCATDAPVVFSGARITGWEVAARRRGPQRGTRAGVPIAGRAFRLRTAAARSATRRPPSLLALQ